MPDHGLALFFLQQKQMHLDLVHGCSKRHSFSQSFAEYFRDYVMHKISLNLHDNDIDNFTMVSLTPNSLLFIGRSIDTVLSWVYILRVALQV